MMYSDHLLYDFNDYQLWGNDKIRVPNPGQNFLRHLASLSMPYLNFQEKLEIKLFATPYSEFWGKMKMEFGSKVL